LQKNIKKLYQQQSQIRPYNVKQTNEDRIIEQIRNNLTRNNAMVSKADKGNSLVILYEEEYSQKVEEFIRRRVQPKVEEFIRRRVQPKVEEFIRRRVQPKVEEFIRRRVQPKVEEFISNNRS
jgi:hypothetical protein